MKFDSPEFDLAITEHLKAHRIVGLAACRLQGGEIAWAKGYGWADLSGARAMTPDATLNIGSISKTFTCTALMQLWEQGKFQLDDPVSEHLPFMVQHPQHTTRITIRQLLTHTSAIADGPAYGASYACGDPTTALGDWLQRYLLPEGKHYDPEKNFYPYPPGREWNYSNVAYGLLGYLCEILAGMPFHLYCKEHLFAPLGMDDTGWLLSEMNVENHAIPYALPGTPSGWRPLYAVQPDLVEGSQSGLLDPVPLCLYSFPNYPDGLVRTSARQLALYAGAFASQGKRQGGPLLKPNTVQRCFTVELDSRRAEEDMGAQGLTWGSRVQANGMRIWGHDGGDPGINSRLQVRPEDGGGIVIITNTNHSLESMDTLGAMLWEAEV